jgi:hypothetical protein
MSPRKREEIHLPSGQTWDAVEVRRGLTRRGPGDAADAFLAQLEASGRLTAVDVKTVRSQPRRGIPSTLDFEMDADPEAVYVTMARHESGAIVFVKPSGVERRSALPGAAKTLRFSIPIPQSTPEVQQRRGVVGKLVKVAVLKVVGKLASKSMPILTKLCETGIWKLKKLHEGWKTISPEALLASSLPDANLSASVSTDPSKRNLLFIHGTFSHASSAFSGLANTRGSDGKTFFEAVQPLYGNRVFAFDHFSVSHTLEENAQALLDRLPKGPCVFDVVTHSRGGLVLRTLVEMAASLGPKATSFQLGRAVLVASPNDGTPLASPNRFEDFLNWLSNVIDMFPDNPFTSAAGFVAEALAWLAHAVQVDIPGLAAMNNQGAIIHQLQSSSGPPPKAYSSLVSNFQPDQNILSRMLDVGVDLVFQTANDLVVPTEGGWLVDQLAAHVIPGDQIGCYGQDGNLPNPTDGGVTHVSFFSHPQTVDFLVQSLTGKAHGIPVLDPGTRLRYLLRRAAMLASSARPAGLPAAVVSTPSQQRAAPAVAPLPTVSASLPSEIISVDQYPDEVLYFSVLGSDEEYRKTRTATLLATFRNARALIEMRTHGDEAGKRLHNIIQKQRDMHSFVNGEPNAKPLPDEAGLVSLGKDIFETLFRGEVRRLYDAARTAQPNGQLHIIFTSMISWIADLPWEFAYDPVRKNFLATSEVNFTRNVDTAIPADRISSRDHLRILVVVAQPLGLAHLSVDEEITRVKSGFQDLIAAGLAQVDVLLDVTPALLHQTLQVSRPYDILHFIGHGEFNEDTGTGCLVFETENQGVQTVDSQVLQQIVCRRGIRLMFLNACETGKGGRADFNRGVAPALVAAGVPVVVANQFSVLDVSATAFARHFYWALAQGRSVGDAAREARVAVNYSISGEAIDWAVPVVFARNPADQLASCKAAAGEQVITAQRDRVAESRARRNALPARDSRTIMGLWDVHHALPRLDAIAARLTAVQDKYLFKTVSFVAPLGTWQREKNEGLAYLNAPQVATRLHEKPKELGLQHLVAITSFPVRDEETLNLYIWDDDVGHQISVVSTHGFLEQLKPPFDVEHFIANTVAFLIGGMESHKQGAKNCPFYYNDECAIESIAGQLKLCGPCERRLKKDPGTMKAIEGILQAFS